MKKFIQIHFTNDNLLVPQNFCDLQSNYCNESLREKEEEVQVDQLESGSSDDFFMQTNDAEFALDEGYPNLSEPFPNVSLKGQLHIAAKNRKKLMDYQRGCEERLLMRWHNAQREKNKQLASIFLEEYDTGAFQEPQIHRDLQEIKPRLIAAIVFTYSDNKC